VDADLTFVAIAHGDQLRGLVFGLLGGGTAGFFDFVSDLAEGWDVGVVCCWDLDLAQDLERLSAIVHKAGGSP